MMQIIDLKPEDDVFIQQVAGILVESFREHWPDAWPDMESALKDVRGTLREDRISRIMVDEGGLVLGWIGGIRHSDGKSYELHPIVVRDGYRRRGLGSILLSDFEKRVAELGAVTVWLGTDDEDGMTTISGIDLYSDVFGHLQNIGNLKSHPYEFYVKQGYSIVGVLPDASGPGKPDILLSKRVR